MNTINVSKNGSITLPDALRSQLGFAPGATLAFSVVGDELRLRPRRSELRRFIGVFSGHQPVTGGQPDLTPETAPGSESRLETRITENAVNPDGA